MRLRTSTLLVMLTLVGVFSNLRHLSAAPATTVIRAKLIFPDIYPLETHSCAFWEMPLEIDFTNSSDAYLSLDLYVENGRIAVGPDAEVTIKDSTGKQLNSFFFMSMPPFANGSINVGPGQHLRVALFVWNGSVTIPQDGWYTVQVGLQLTDSAKRRVTIQTDEKRVHFEPHGGG